MKEIIKLIETSQWRFAKSMPKIPHEYLLKKTLDIADKLVFEKFVMHIREHGYKKRFFNRIYIYFDIDGKSYWTMGQPLEKTILINRAKSVKN